jgi:chitinase
MKKIYGYNPIHDKTTAVKYFSYGTDQWVSYDDAETLQAKVDFAQQQGYLHYIF